MRYSFAERKNQLRRIATHAARACVRAFARTPRIVVSMTSYPLRIATVHVAIQSLLAQRRLPDMVVLYLCRSDFPGGKADLPEDLRRLLSFDVKVRFVDDDLKPHKKYFFALQEFPRDLVVTVDDDLIYRNTMIEELVSAHGLYPSAIVGLRTHCIMFDKRGHMASYSDWVFEAPRFHNRLVGVPSMRLFVTTGAGTLFPPHCLPPEAFDKQAICDTCLDADDVWVNVARLISHTEVVAATANQALTYIPDTQEVGLYHTNLDRGGNDVMLDAVFAHFAGYGISATDFADARLDTLMDES